MTFQGVLDLLKETERKLRNVGIDDDAKLDLEILILQLKRQAVILSFDPLRELDNVTVVDLSQLRQLVAEVAREIQNEQKRVALVRRITAIAKGGLKAAGLPIPS